MSLLALPGCRKQNAGGSDSAVPLKLTLDWRPEPEFGGFYAAAQKQFADNKLNVAIQIAGEGAPTWQLVAGGQTDFATTAADQVLIARSQGVDVVAIFAVYQTCPQGIMVHTARDFKGLEDVFKHPGTLAAEDNGWLKYCVAKYQPTEVTLTSFAGGIAPFLAKADYSQQCFITSEPIEARQKGADVKTFLIADSGYNPYTTVVITQGDRVRNHPAQVSAMIEACRAGWRAYLDNPAPANQMMHVLNPQMDDATFAAAAAAQKPLIDTDPAHPLALGSMSAERWSLLGQQLQSSKVLSKVPPATECFVNADQLKP